MCVEVVSWKGYAHIKPHMNLYFKCIVAVLLVFSGARTGFGQCPDAGPDTLVCGFEYELQGSEVGGSWYTVCSEDAGAVMFGSPQNDTTEVKVDRCGEYTFVYEVLTGPCAGTDTVIVFFDDPSRTLIDQELVINLTLEAECHASPPPDYCDNVVEVTGQPPPTLIWDFCGNELCTSIIYDVSSTLSPDSCLATAIVCDSTITSDAGSHCASFQDVDASNILDIIGDIFDEIDLGCPIAFSCYQPPPECIDTIIDTIRIPIPILDGGLWHYIDSNGLQPMGDTTFLTIDGRDYVLIVEPSADHYGPEDLTFTLWEIGGGGTWIYPTVNVDLSIQWQLNYIYDTLTIIDTAMILKDSCRAPCGGLRINPANINIPPPPDYPCGPVDLTFGPQPESQFYTVEINCAQPVVVIEVCPGEIEDFFGEGQFWFQCIDADNCPYEVLVEVYENFTTPQVGNVTTWCVDDSLSYNVTFDIVGGSGPVSVSGVGEFNYGDVVTIVGIPNCSEFEINLMDEFSFCEATESVYHCCDCPQTSSVTEAAVCEGSAYFFNGQWHDTTGIYTYSLTNVQGCDSTAVLDLTVFDLVPTSIDAVICDGDIYLLGSQILTDPGVYTDTLITAQGCDSIVIVDLEVRQVAFEIETTADCAGDGTGSLSVLNANGGLEPYVYSIDGINFQDRPDFEDLSSGEYTVFVIDAMGCSEMGQSTISAIGPIEVTLEEEYYLCGGQPIVLDVTQVGQGMDSVTYEWSNGTTGPVFEAQQAGEYWVEITTQCESKQFEFRILVDDEAPSSKIYVPNVFTPNNDGVNDVFKAFSSVPLVAFEMHLYDRWGDELIEMQSIDEFWDGTFLEQRMNPGVYVWWLKATAVNCDGTMEEVLLKGDVTLIR